MARGRHPTRIHTGFPDELTAARYLFQWDGRELQHEPHRFPGFISPELFGNNLPLEIDFGCGTGILTCNRARRHPQINMLGIDRSQKPLFYAVSCAAASRLENVKFIRGDFNIMLPLLRPESVRAAYYLFPNPPRDYLKTRANTKRRNFLLALHNALIPGGRFYFATDASSFFECVETIVTGDLHLRTVECVYTTWDIFTQYKRIWEEKGRSIRSIVVQK